MSMGYVVFGIGLLWFIGYMITLFKRNDTFRLFIMTFLMPKVEITEKVLIEIGCYKKSDKKYVLASEKVTLNVFFRNNAWEVWFENNDIGVKINEVHYLHELIFIVKAFN